MVWACFGYGYKSELVIFPSRRDDDGILKAFRLDSKRYVKRCLQKVVPDILARGKTLLQDGARSHASQHTTQYLLRKGVPFFCDFPPYSPDFNMIEPLWKTFAERVGLLCPMTLDELCEAAKKVWNELPQSLLDAHAGHFHGALRKSLR